MFYKYVLLKSFTTVHWALDTFRLFNHAVTSLGPAIISYLRSFNRFHIIKEDTELK